jgi:hypothetical protein
VGEEGGQWTAHRHQPRNGATCNLAVLSRRRPFETPTLVLLRFAHRRLERARALHARTPQQLQQQQQQHRPTHRHTDTPRAHQPLSWQASVASCPCLYSPAHAPPPHSPLSLSVCLSVCVPLCLRARARARVCVPVSAHRFARSGALGIRGRAPLLRTAPTRRVCKAIDTHPHLCWPRCALHAYPCRHRAPQPTYGPTGPFTSRAQPVAPAVAPQVYRRPAHLRCPLWGG